MRLTFPLICLSSGLLVPLSCQPAFAADVAKQSLAANGPRLILAMQAPSTTVAPATPPAVPTPPAELDCSASAGTAATAEAQALTAPPAVSLSSTLSRWARQERRAERQKVQFHPVRRLLSLPSRVVLVPYVHPVPAAD